MKIKQNKIIIEINENILRKSTQIKRSKRY